MTDDDGVVRACKQLIVSKRCVLWCLWNVSEPKGLQEAAEWLAEQIREVETILMGDLLDRMSEPTSPG